MRTRQIQDASGSDLFAVELFNDVLAVRLLNIGATLWQVRSAGAIDANLCLSMGDPFDYHRGSSYIGVTAGPVANRIGRAAFEIDEERFILEPNEGSNQLHGGPTGFSHKLWGAEVDQDPDRVRFTTKRPDGEGGYPGNLDVSVTYQLEGNRLRYQWKAMTDRTTPVSLTNHAYWNLAGSGTIADHTLQVVAEQLVTVDDTAIPTGELAPVADTGFDLRDPTFLGDVIQQQGEGIDHCYVLSQETLSHASPSPQTAVTLNHPGSGRRLRIATTLPGIQVYTGQFLDGSSGAGGYGKHGGLCLETQHLPDAVNQPSFPSCLVHPGSPVTHTTDYFFSL